MIEKKRDDLEQKEAEDHDESVKEAEQYMNTLNEKNSTKELEIKTRFEEKIAREFSHIETLKTRFKEKEKMLEKLENRTAKLKEKIEQEKEKLTEKIEKTKAKINNTTEKLETRAQAAINNAKTAIDIAKQNVTENTTASRLLANAQEKLASAQASFTNKNYGMAFGQATAAEAIAKSITRMDKRVKENETD